MIAILLNFDELGLNLVELLCQTGRCISKCTVWLLAQLQMTAGHDLADQDFPMAKEIPTAAGHKV